MMDDESAKRRTEIRDFDRSLKTWSSPRCWWATTVRSIGCLPGDWDAVETQLIRDAIHPRERKLSETTSMASLSLNGRTCF